MTERIQFNGMEKLNGLDKVWSQQNAFKIIFMKIKFQQITKLLIMNFKYTFYILEGNCDCKVHGEPGDGSVQGTCPENTLCQPDGSCKLCKLLNF